MSESASIEAEDVKNVKSSIEQIPRELIWKIIEYAPETVNNMRLVSKIRFSVNNG